MRDDWAFDSVPNVCIPEPSNVFLFFGRMGDAEKLIAVVMEATSGLSIHSLEQQLKVGRGACILLVFADDDVLGIMP